MRTRSTWRFESDIVFSTESWYFQGGVVLPRRGPGWCTLGSHSRIYALGAAAGDLLWSHYTRGWTGDPAISDGVLYVGSYDTDLYALALPT